MTKVKTKLIRKILLKGWYNTNLTENEKYAINRFFEKVFICGEMRAYELLEEKEEI